jgi:GNAT superfamily N-acetyltransferase
MELSPQFADMSFEHIPATPDYRRNRLLATQGKKILGTFDWHPDTHEIESVNVKDEYQRHGIATAMLHHAQSNYVPEGQQIRHSPERSAQGEGWARANADFPMPPNKNKRLR